MVIKLQHGLTNWQAVRPRMRLYKTFEEAANAVDEIFNTAYQNAGCMCNFLDLYASG